jgi:hypothetical protein
MPNHLDALSQHVFEDVMTVVIAIAARKHEYADLHMT